MFKYGYTKESSLSFPEALEKIKEELSKKGFSVLWEMDVKSKIKEKLGKDFGNYTILGACNAPIAFNVLSQEIESGLLLPCNVVVFENGGKTSVGFLKPSAILGLTENTEIAKIASDAEIILNQVFDNIN